MEIDNKRLILALSLVFGLGILFSVVNGAYTNSTNEQLPLIVYAISFVSLLVGASLILLFQYRINKIHINRILKLLPRDERAIIKILLDNNNQLEQNKLVILSGFNKVQVSRITDKLEEREVLEKKNMGNTKLIVLKV